MTASSVTSGSGTTREALLAAALDLMERVGYASFSYRDLSTAVGITTASIHYHFPGKADLGLALLEDIRRRHEDEERNLRTAHPGVRARLLALTEHLDRSTSARGRSCPISLFQAEYAILPPAVQAAVRALVEHKLSLLADWLEEGRAAGALRFPGSARDQALLVWSVFEHGPQLARSSLGASFPALARQLIATMTPEASP
jgi:TetR/AcrR family transcriptional repressor of nem operon